MKRTVRAGRPALVRLICLSAAVAAFQPAAARDASAIGPYSPYAGPDGDIRSELPGCRGRTRPAEGSLDDEMGFRRDPRETPDGIEPHRRRKRPVAPDVDQEE